jgi:(1->4)-alpha-D-glucan 1-alpha-D-glucosylmutase
MAKAVEDTTYYNFTRFISLNEVGGNPACFGLSPAEFHAAMARRQEQWPESLLATSTHDTKRSEDVRARLDILSEMPEQWAQAVRRWSEHAAPYRTGALPDANDEYLLYQTLAGAWPLTAERAQAYMLKAARESKRHTSWADQDEAYETALAAFVAGVMNDVALQADLAAFVRTLLVPGYHNSLAQTLLKLTVPGVPDIYQGTELWDFSLVDPDNRRPVDFALRRALLGDLARQPTPEAILARLDEGLPKLLVVQRTLHLRAAHPDWFGPGATYEPLPVAGSDAALAFARGDKLVVAVPRLPLHASQHGWGDAAIMLPSGPWQHALTGDTFPAGPTRLQDLFARFPVALLTREDDV